METDRAYLLHRLRPLDQLVEVAPPYRPTVLTGENERVLSRADMSVKVSTERR